MNEKRTARWQSLLDATTHCRPICAIIGISGLLVTTLAPFGSTCSARATDSTRIYAPDISTVAFVKPATHTSTDEVGALSDRPFALVPDGKLPDATRGTAFFFSVANPEAEPLFFLVDGEGVLPPGLQMDNNGDYPGDGSIFGIPTESGTFTFRVGYEETDYEDFTIVVNEQNRRPNGGWLSFSLPQPAVLPNTL
jgi:hypothetical protein